MPVRTYPHQSQHRANPAQHDACAPTARRRFSIAVEWSYLFVIFLYLASLLASTGPVHTTCAGLVIQPLDPSWATVRIWTDAPVIEQGPGINRQAWEYITPAPYQLSSAASLTLTGPGVVWYVQDGVGSTRFVYGGVADFNSDGDLGTDSDIAAFFACLSGDCCPACDPDFDGDGDPGTDADIERFFRALGGGEC